ncbi:aminotransferase class V-fold PLP-dependent enzyme (plasmid) [Gluconobacter thailandicus]|uniref:Aminotransferase class V-fold PLP-dependent enzyme n=2 Tax=Gluconobacter thailandicus TaxID=257438 RepID=A0AAP9JJI9_GLUTH|nr:aminotransferase class V-fold PLP-dependent enzyme [Gluconobacter thailandicus]
MTANSSRRTLLKAALASPAAFSVGRSQAETSSPSYTSPHSINVVDLPGEYDIDPTIHNLENGYWGVMPRVVAETYARHTIAVNRSNSIWARNMLPGGACLAGGGHDARAAIARQVGCDIDELAIARSGSDALQMLIANYKPLRPGDAVIHCDLDYDAMIAAVNWLGDHRGAQIVSFVMPEPATTANILQAYQDILNRTPRAKLLLVTQVSNRTGLVTPVREIVAMARARGVDTIVDAAHGIACLDFQLADIDADFVGWSVHKWTSAPLGTGALYVRKNRLQDIDIAFDNGDIPAGSVTARIPAGTINFAAILSIPTAVDFHFAIGAAAKERHLRALRNRWVDQVRDLPNVEICVPDDPDRYCTITSFRLRGMKTDADAQKLQRTLFEKYRVHTVWRKGVHNGPVVRVTPGLYNTYAASDALVAALRKEHTLFL